MEILIGVMVYLFLLTFILFWNKKVQDRNHDADEAMEREYRGRVK